MNDLIPKHSQNTLNMDETALETTCATTATKVTLDASLPKKRSGSSINTVSSKRIKKEPTVEKNKGQNTSKESVNNNLITNSSLTKNEGSVKDVVATKKRLVWKDNW